MLAARGIPTAWQLGWIVVAMVAARSAAMAFNRLADADYDAENPRTRDAGVADGAADADSLRLRGDLLHCVYFRRRAIEPALPGAVAGGAGGACCFTPTPKRFTRWSHLVLGFADAIPPAGAWIAVRGSLRLREFCC